ncbi:21583_t:CDS:1, partial [Racocetra persica]
SINNSASTTDFVSTVNSASTADFVLTNNSTLTTSTPDNRQVSKKTIDLLKEIETICNRAGHVQTNNDLALFVNQLNNKYPLSQNDIDDPAAIATKGRPSGTKRQKTGAEHAIKKVYMCGFCGGAGHNTRKCPQK